MQSNRAVQQERAGLVPKTKNKDFAFPKPRGGIKEETFAEQKRNVQAQDKPVNIPCRTCLPRNMPLLHLAAALVCARDSLIAAWLFVCADDAPRCQHSTNRQRSAASKHYHRQEGGDQFPSLPSFRLSVSASLSLSLTLKLLHEP
jgi:hypothetical protein